jgi:hypothetical protein
LPEFDEPDKTLRVSVSPMSPSIFSTGCPLGRRGRWGLLAVSLMLLAGFALARSLTPDPRGFGTHQQFGLPECTVQILFNRPCPGCGMTTAFANLVRGQWTAAARANPAGVLLGAVCALLIPWMWLSAWRGITVGVSAPLETLLALVVCVSGTTVAVWVCRMFL